MDTDQEIQFFIKSAGSRPDQGYQWWQVGENNSLIKNDPSFVKDLSKVEWLDREAFLLLVLRNDEDIHLYVTALETQGREDFQGRKIRNDIAISIRPDEEWSGQESRLLDFISALLQDQDKEIERDLNKIILQTTDNSMIAAGFTTDYNSILKWFESAPKAESRNGSEQGRWIGKDSQKNRIHLSELLKKHYLPKQNGFLVAVTRYTDPAHFIESNSWWRVLTSLENESEWRQLECAQQQTRIIDQPSVILISTIALAILTFLLVIMISILL